MTITLDGLREANVERNKEWDPSDAITLSFRGNELAGEVGEACNHIKKLDRERLGLRGSRTTPEALATELADVIICVDLIAMHLGIDLSLAVIHKFNQTSEEQKLKTRL
jgi:NTP pyrophosphatase (non-canonical NTP hydrolase)